MNSIKKIFLKSKKVLENSIPVILICDFVKDSMRGFKEISLIIVVVYLNYYVFVKLITMNF